MFNLVKITNDFGDNYVGKSGNAIYQKQWGQQVRRMGYKEKKEPSIRQQEVRQRFKDAIQWVKDLPFEDRRSLKQLYETTSIAYDKKYPVNWYNFAKWLYIQDPKFSILNVITNEYKISHPALLSVKEYDVHNVLRYSSDILSTFDSPNLDKSFVHTPISYDSRIEITLLTGLTMTQVLGSVVVPVAEMLYYDSKFYEIIYYE